MTGGASAGAVRDRRDLYSMLGVAPDATTEEIAAAFRARAKEMHPDRTPGDEAAAEDFKALSRAYATLRAPRSRAAYDARRFAASTSTSTRTSTRTSNRTSASAADVEPRTPILSTIARARWAIAGGVACILLGLAIAPVLLSLSTGPDTVGRDVTLWLVVAKLVICGAILVGAGWWRLVALRAPARRSPTVPTDPRSGRAVPTEQ